MGLVSIGYEEIFAGTIAGAQRLSLKMNGSVRIEGLKHEYEREVNIAPARVLLVGFGVDNGFQIDGSGE